MIFLTTTFQHYLKLKLKMQNCNVETPPPPPSLKSIMEYFMVSIHITVLKKFDTKYNAAPARFGFKAHETNLAEHKNRIIKSARNSTTT